MTTLKKILEPALKRKKQKHPHFSMRQLAGKLQVSPAFLTNILNEQKKFPIEHLDAFIDFLELDDINVAKLCKYLHWQQIKNQLQQSKHFKNYYKLFATNKKNIQLPASDTNYSELPISQMHLLDPWYHIAILDLIATADFVTDSKWIAQRLGIGVQQAENAWTFLQKNNYVKFDAVLNRFVKNEAKIRFPTRESHYAIRAFHTQMIKKGVEAMNASDSQVPFAKRLITSLTVGTNPANFETGKAYLHESLYHAADILAEGEAEELYQMCVLLFPLTK